jgi:hypothetical protein
MFVITNFHTYVTTLILRKKHEIQNVWQKKMCDFLDFNIVITTYV